MMHSTKLHDCRRCLPVLPKIDETVYYIIKNMNEKVVQSDILELYM